MTRESASSPRRIQIAERRARLLELRLAGLTFEQIVTRYPDLGYKTSSAAAQDAVRALDQHVGKPAAELVALEAARLERLNQAAWPGALRGDNHSIDTARKLSESRRKLHGLDAVDRKGSDSSDVDAWLDGMAGQPPDDDEGSDE